MIPEAALEQTEHGLLPASDGWYVLNARDAPWSDRAGCAHDMVKQGEADFAQLGVGLCVLEPGGPMSICTTERPTRGGLPRALRRGTGHRRGRGTSATPVGPPACPAGTKHVIAGGGDGPCTIFTVGARWNHTYRKPDGTLEGRDDWGAYTVDEAAIRHGAGVEVETNDADVAYAAWPKSELTRYRDGWLPSY